ncbi:MAG: hypothetical protein FJZ57_03450 [Chlamydiae bacterium]|nr:hypothetical protein [Chlamydiota bacterium]
MKRVTGLFILSFCLISSTPSFCADESPQASILSPLPQQQNKPEDTPQTPPPQTPPAQAQTQQTDKQDFQNPLDNDMTMPSYEGAIVKMLLTLVGLVGMVVMTVWVLKKLSQGRIGAFGKKQIAVIERRPLSPKTVLYIVEVSGKQVLIAESHLEVKALTTLDTPVDS